MKRSWVLLVPMPQRPQRKHPPQPGVAQGDFQVLQIIILYLNFELIVIERFSKGDYPRA